MASGNLANVKAQPTPPPTAAKTKEKPEPVKAELGGIQRAIAWFQSEETSLLSKIAVLAVAFFALLTLGSLTGKIAISFIAAAAVVGGSCIWAATKGVLEPISKEAPKKVVSEKEKAAIEEFHQKFIKVLEMCGMKYQTFPSNIRGVPISRSVDLDKRPLVTLNLLDLETQTTSTTEFVRNKTGYWVANSNENEFSPFSKMELVTQENQETILKQLQEIVTGHHSKHVLAFFADVSG